MSFLSSFKAPRPRLGQNGWVMADLGFWARLETDAVIGRIPIPQGVVTRSLRKPSDVERKPRGLHDYPASSIKHLQARSDMLRLLFSSQFSLQRRCGVEETLPKTSATRIEAQLGAVSHVLFRNCGVLFESNFRREIRASAGVSTHLSAH